MNENRVEMKFVKVSLLPEDFAALCYITDTLRDHADCGEAYSKQDAVRFAIRAYEGMLKRKYNNEKKN